MRTARELAGWFLLPIVQLTFFGAPLLALASVIDRPDEWIGYEALALFAIAAWPGLWLTARRWREPSAEATVLGDGRKPVLLLHSFVRARLPFWRRFFLWQPGLWRDVAELRLERALSKGFGRVGPLLPFARPAAMDHGPVALLRSPEWHAELDRRLHGAAMVLIEVDAREHDRKEIERAWTSVGGARVVLILPVKPDAGLGERWEAWRALWPALPPFSGELCAVRFDPEGRAFPIAAHSPALGSRLTMLASSSLVLREHEIVDSRPVHWLGWLALGIPAVGGIVSAFYGYFWLEVTSIHVPHDMPVGFGLGTTFFGITIAIAGRRLLRPAPMNEAVLVTIAALPWLVMATGERVLGSRSSDFYSLQAQLRSGAVGAAYSAPLLAATALMLALIPLARPATDRRFAYALFGAAAMIPIVTGVASLGEDASGPALFLLFVVGIAMSIASWSASGSPSRSLAPPSLGAAIAASLAATATMSVCLSSAYTRQLRALESYPGTGALVQISREGRSLLDGEGILPYFALALPLVVALVAMQFARRGRGSSAQALALLPLILLLSIEAPMRQTVRDSVGARAEATAAPFVQAALGTVAVAALSLPEIYGGTLGLPSEPADVVLDASGVVVDGRRLARQDELQSRQMLVRGALRRHRLVSQRGAMRIAVDASTPVPVFVALAGDAQNAGFGAIDVIVLDGDRSSLMRFSLSMDERPEYAGVRWFLSLQNGQYALQGTDGTYVSGDETRLVETIHGLGISAIRPMAPSGTVGDLVSIGSIAHRAGIAQLVLINAF